MVTTAHQPDDPVEIRNLGVAGSILTELIAEIRHYAEHCREERGRRRYVGLPGETLPCAIAVLDSFVSMFKLVREHLLAARLPPKREQELLPRLALLECYLDRRLRELQARAHMQEGRIEVAAVSFIADALTFIQDRQPAIESMAAAILYEFQRRKHQDARRALVEKPWLALAEGGSTPERANESPAEEPSRDEQPVRRRAGPGRRRNPDHLKWFEEIERLRVSLNITHKKAVEAFNRVNGTQHTVEQVKKWGQRSKRQAGGRTDQAA